MNSEIKWLCDRLDTIEPNSIVYVSIGSAAHMMKKKDNSNQYILEPTYNQQYPIFLQNLRKKYTHIPIHIFLMDPELESPSWIISNENRQISDNIKYIDSDIYLDKSNNLQIYEFRHLVSYPCDHYPSTHSIRIHDFLNKLNNYSIKYNWLTVCHDFSGRNIAKLAYYYDDMLRGHLNHIIYGLAARDDRNCYIDLCLPECDFVSDYDGKSITVFNPYDCIKNNISDNIIISKQIELSRKVSKDHIINDILTCMRQIGLVLDGENIQISVWDTAYIRDKYTLPIDKMIEEKEFEILYGLIISICEKEITKYLEKKHTTEYIDKLFAKVYEQQNHYRKDSIIRNEL
jgi:hypothetical protein